MIEVRQLTKRFGAVAAVDRLSFQVKAGTVTGFLGPNGSGKISTLRMLVGLVRPDSGQARIWGNRYADLGVWRRKVGVVLEASGFHPGRTVRDHLRVRCAATGQGRHTGCPRWSPARRRGAPAPAASAALWSCPLRWGREKR